MAKSSITRSGWIGIFVVIVLIVVSVLIYFYIKGKKNKNAPKPKSTIPIKTQSTKGYIPESFPLNVGMEGQYVQQLQAAIGVDQDTKFGPITKAAVLAKGYNVPLSEADYNKLAIIGQPVYAYSDGILVLNDDFSTNPVNVKEGDFLGNIVSVSDASYLINPSSSTISAPGNIYVHMADVFFGDLK